MTLRQKQSAFARLYAKLILHAYELGFEITLGHTLRSEIEAKRLGMEKSLHRLKLAGDLNLFRNGRYLRSTKSHKPLGIWWEKQSTNRYTCCWGGRFGDGNHYSIMHQGRK